MILLISVWLVVVVNGVRTLRSGKVQWWTEVIRSDRTKVPGSDATRNSGSGPGRNTTYGRVDIPRRLGVVGSEPFEGTTVDPGVLLFRDPTTVDGVPESTGTSESRLGPIRCRRLR